MEDEMKLEGWKARVVLTVAIIQLVWWVMVIPLAIILGFHH